MSAVLLLNALLQNAKAQYSQGLTEDEVFEQYCADNILINYDLDAAEIERGLIDGPRDAGIDAAYVFANARPVAEDLDLTTLQAPIDLELVLIQSKCQDSFKEAAVDKLAASLPILLDFNRKRGELEQLFKKEVVDAFKGFLEAISALAHKFPRTSIRIYYCSKGDQPNGTVLAKAQAVESMLQGLHFPEVVFSFLGAQKLYERSSEQKTMVRKLSTTGTPISGSHSFLALAKLTDYRDFISEGDGALMARMFEANVRAYQGDIEVNREISESLKQPGNDIDFWWLNNGVTLVADQASYVSNQLVIENPLVVNGLQTSHEIHSLGNELSAGDGRCILCRVIVEKDLAKRDQIIRATNRQTSISSSSFRAGEPVHREIEDFLKTLGYYYDRRKNQYKREGKPTDKIVSIDKLAQAVLALLLQEPHTARARPTTAIKNEADYQRIFSANRETHPLKLYEKAVVLLERVEEHFRSIKTDVDRIYRNNLRFHVLMVLGWAINEGRTMPVEAVVSLKTSKLPPTLLEAVADWVFIEFSAAGAEDKTAKDASFTEALKASWNVTLTSG